MKSLVAVPARSACLFLTILLLPRGGSSDCVSGPLCGDGGATDLVAASVTLSSATLSFSSLGETQQLTATVQTQSGQPLVGARDPCYYVSGIT